MIQNNFNYEKSYECILWGIANLLGDDDYYQKKSEIFESNIMSFILQSINNIDNKNVRIYESEAWVLSNSLKGPNFPRFEQVIFLINLLGINSC